MAPRIPCMPNLVRTYPLISCLTLLLFTPPVFRLLLFFSPLLVSTALCVLALVSLGPHLAASEGHSKAHESKIHDSIIGLTPNYWHLGDEIAAKKFEDCLNEKSETGLILKLEACGHASGSNHFLVDMHNEMQMTEGVLACEDQIHVGRNSNPRSAAFEDRFEISDEEGNRHVENATSVSTDIGNQVLTEALHEVSSSMSDLDVANKIPVVANGKMISDLSGLESESPSCEKTFKIEEDGICKENIDEREALQGTGSGSSMENQEDLVSAGSEERNRDTSGDGGEMLNMHESQNRLEFKQPLLLNDGFVGKIPEEDQHEAAHREETAAATRGPSNANRIQLLEHLERVPAVKQQNLENGPAQNTAMPLRCEQEETVALHERRCRPRSSSTLRRTSTQETAKSTRCMQLQDEPSSTLYGLARGFQSSFDPWESSIWGRDPIQEETSSFGVAQTV